MYCILVRTDPCRARAGSALTLPGLACTIAALIPPRLQRRHVHVRSSPAGPGAAGSVTLSLSAASGGVQRGGRSFSWRGPRGSRPSTRAPRRRRRRLWRRPPIPSPPGGSAAAPGAAAARRSSRGAARKAGRCAQNKTRVNWTRASAGRARTARRSAVREHDARQLHGRGRGRTFCSGR